MPWMGAVLHIWAMLGTSSRGVRCIWERLDRAVATNNWISIFPTIKVVHLEYGTSNHKALFIHPLGIPPRQNKPWQFEQVLLKEDRYHATVNSAWRNVCGGASPITMVVENLKNCQTRLRSWS